MPSRSLPLGALFWWGALGTAAAVVAWSLPIDDFWLTLASGRAIASGVDPTMAMPFSWTQEVPDARNPQWGAQILLGAHGSLALALAINGGLVALGLLLTALRATARAAAVPIAIALLITLTGLAPHLLSRAQSFSIALFPLAVVMLERWSGRAWLPVAYGAVMVVWANTHGAFVVGQLAAVAWLAAAVVQRRPLLIPLATALMAAIAPLVNPSGPALLAYAYGQPAAEVVRAISTEWQPSWPWLPLAIPFWLILLGFVAGRLLRRPGIGLAELLVLVPLAVLGASGIRHIPWFLLGVMPVLAEDIGLLVERRPRLRRALGQVDRVSGPGAARVVTAVAIAVVAFQLLRPSLPAPIARLTPDEPVAAVDQLAVAVETGDRVLNEQEWGGYLAYRLWPDVETAMDGRLEIRSLATWDRYFSLMRGREDPVRSLAAQMVRWALISPERTALLGALEGAGWELVHDDDYSLLLRAPSSGE